MKRFASKIGHGLLNGLRYLTCGNPFDVPYDSEDVAVTPTSSLSPPVAVYYRPREVDSVESGPLPE